MEPVGLLAASVMVPAEVPLANVYAEATLDLAPADADAEAVAAELAELVNLLRATPELDHLLFRAPISVSARTHVVERLFHGLCTPVVDGLLGVLAHRDRLGLLPTIAHRFRKLLDRREGKVDVTVTTAVPMDDATRQSVVEAMKNKLHATPSLHELVDPHLVGGMVVNVAGKVYDDSIAAELGRMREKLVAAISKKQTGGGMPTDK